MKCSCCGLENKEGAFFCAGCGTRLEAVAGTPDAQAQPESQPQPEIQAQPQPEPQPQPEVQAQPQSEPQAQPTDERKPDHTVKGRTFGIIGFILSIQAIIGCLIPIANIVSLVYAIVGIIFAAISRKNVELKLSRVGNVLSIIALVFSVLTIILYCILFAVLIDFIIESGPIDFGDFVFDFGGEGIIINLG